MMIGSASAGNYYIGIDGGANIMKSTGIGKIPIARAIGLNVVSIKDNLAFAAGEDVQQRMRLYFKPGFNLNFNLGYKTNRLSFGFNVGYSKNSYKYFLKDYTKRG